MPESVDAPVRHIEEWSELLSGSFARFTFEAPDPAGFRGGMGVRTIAGVDFLRMSSDAHTARREVAGAGTGERADYLVSLTISGTGEFSQDGRTAMLRPGDLTVFDTTRPTTVCCSDGYRNLCMKFPQQALGLAPARMDELTAARFRADDGLTPAVRGVLSTLDAVADSLPGRGGRLAASSALQLVATLFESSLGAPDGSRARAHAALLDRMRDYIERHLHDPELSPAAIAAAHYVSLRQLHAMFEGTGSTVAASIRMLRHERARRALVDPGLDALPVAAVAARCGFSTPSAFGRAFREVYGVSPGRYREDAVGATA